MRAPRHGAGPPALTVCSGSSTLAVLLVPRNLTRLLAATPTAAGRHGSQWLIGTMPNALPHIALNVRSHDAIACAQPAGFSFAVL
jgi:hypothetical protein